MRGDYFRGTGWYRRAVTWDQAWTGRRVYLQFDGANRRADAFINGRLVGSHLGGHARFRFDVTDALRRDGLDAAILAAHAETLQFDVEPVGAEETQERSERGGGGAGAGGAPRATDGAVFIAGQGDEALGVGGDLGPSGVTRTFAVGGRRGGACGRARVEAGAQGGHKLARGYEPVQTWSAHWIADPGFRAAVADFLERERAGVASDQLYLGGRTPFKKA